MKKYIDLSQTPFIDLRQNKNNTNFIIQSKLPFLQNLPKSQDQIEYKIHTNFTKYDQKPYLIANQEDQKIISEIIKAIREELRLGFDIQTSKKFKQMSLKHVNTVVKYLKEENPQAAYIALRAQTYDKRYNLSIDKLKQISKKTLYPLLLSQIVSPLISSFNVKQVALGSDYLDIIIKGGLPEGFLWKGLYQTKLKNGSAAYEMFKNAQRLGYEPAAYKYLGQLFMSKNQYMGANLKLAEKYFSKAKQLGTYFEPYMAKQIQQIQIQKQKQKIKFNSIKSTQVTQAVQLANFISNKMTELKNKNMIKNMHSFGMIHNTTSSESIATFNDPKTFYVVFSPLMSFPGRHFLAKDINGFLEYISIYNWDLIPIQKLKMLHQVGTKIILNDFIRKIGARDDLPLYRVDNPYSVEFYKSTQKHTISDKQFRNFAKNLFQRNLLEKAMAIYQYMIMKGSQQMEIIYSNMGVIYQWQKNIAQAIKCYQNSLKIKKFNKSQIRLANIYLRNEQFDKAQKLIKEIESVSERQELLKQIQKKKEKDNDASDFSKSVKNKHQIKKQILNVSENGVLRMVNSNPSCMVNIREDRLSLLYHKEKFEQALNAKGLETEIFLDLIQSTFNSIENKNLTKLIVMKFLNMTEVAYKLKFKNQKYPCSAFYLAQVLPQAMDLTIGPSPQVGTVYYMSQRQNYLQNRIEDICLQFEQKGQYKQAEEIYRYSENHITPFNVKVAEMLFMQGKYQQCQKYCAGIIQILNKFSMVRFFKYISDLAVWQLKSLIRLNKNQAVVLIGENYIKQFSKKSPKLVYENQNFRSVLTSFNSSKSKYNEVNQLISANQLLQNIYRQIVRAFISMKNIVKARQYLSKIQLKKQNCNYSQLIDHYYQSRILQLLIIKLSDPLKAIKETDLIQKEINSDKKLENKQLYIKFLLKQKLSFLIESQKIPEIIKQSEDIIKINSINFIFVKNKLFYFIKKNPSKIIDLLDKIKSSQILNCIWAQLCQRSKIYLQTSPYIKEESKEKENVLIQLHKLDIEHEQQVQDQQDDNNEQQSTQLSEASFVHNEASHEKNNDFNDQLYKEEYENQICRFQGNNGITFIVIFQQSLKTSLQVAEYRRFVCAADHLCRRQYGSTGIKISGSQLRLKIRMSSRLIGKLKDSPADPKVKFCFFNKRQRHDDYKRQKNK